MPLTAKAGDRVVRSLPRVSGVLPTLGLRPNELLACLRSLEVQTHPLGEIVIVAPDPAVVRRDLPNSYRWPFALSIVRAERVGACPQRNRGVDELCARVESWEAILFLDDDVELEPDYVKLLATHLTAPGVGGAAGISVGSQNPVPHWLRGYSRLFFGRTDGLPRFTLGGLNHHLTRDTAGPVPADWLFGCGMFTQSAAIEARFDETMTGYALMHDVDYSLQVGRRWKMVVDSRARLVHHQAGGGRPDVRELARQHVLARRKLLARHRPGLGSRLAFWWTTLGEVVLSTIGVLGGHDGMRERLWGTLEAAVYVGRGHRTSDGH